MMQQEFTARTGYKPTANEYKDIEAAYYEFNGNKDEFCSMWKEENRGRIQDQKRKALKVAAYEMAQANEDLIYWQIQGVYAFHQITPTIARLMVQYEAAQNTIKANGGKCQYSPITPSFMAYAKKQTE